MSGPGYRFETVNNHTVAINAQTNQITSIRIPVKEKRTPLREIPVQVQAATSKYWADKALTQDQVCLIQNDGNYKIFGDNHIPVLPGEARMRCLSYSDGRIHQNSEKFQEVYNEKSIVAFYKSALDFRAKMDTDSGYAADPKRQKIRDLMDAMVASNAEYFKKIGSKRLEGICVIS